MAGCDFVFHLAANADVRFGTEHPRKDLEQNTIATFNVLEAMRANGIQRIAFSSTGSIYGEPTVFPTPEDAPFPGPDVALRRVEAGRRGADPGLLRRLRLSGLHLPLRLDPRRALHARPRVRFLPEPARRTRRELRVLGNGQQRKSYLYVQDCIDAMLTARSSSAHGQGQHLQPRHRRVLPGERLDRLDHRAPRPRRPSCDYTGGDRGWIGDSPFIFLDTAQDPRARLDAEADDPRGHHPDARLPAGEPVAAGRRAHEGLRLGLWHLGTVTAACLASRRPRRHRPRSRSGRRSPASARGTPPLSEPGLDDLVASGLASGRLRFTTDAAAAVATPTSSGSPSTRRSTTTTAPMSSPWSQRVGGAVPAPARRRARARLVAAAGRHDARGSSGMFAAVAPAAASAFALLAGEPPARQGDRVFTKPDRIVVGVRDDADRETRRGAARAVHRSDRVDVGRVGRDDQARAQRVPRDVGHVHQRDRRALRAGRRRRRRRSSAG